MKIKINYDLIEKIKESKNGIKLDKIVKRVTLATVMGNVILTPLYINRPLEVNMLSVSIITIVNAIGGILQYSIAKSSKDFFERFANLVLDDFVNELSNLEIKTTTELLKEAEVIKSNYKIHFEDDSKIPRLKQEKYIKIKLCNGYTETLLQEHNIGSDDYEISVNEPVKRKSFKLSRATN